MCGAWNSPVPITIRHVHGYTLTRLIGQGGFASVYEAERASDGRSFALKLLHRRFLREPSARRTMINEALASASLSHPSLVALVDVDEDPDLGLYLVSELVRGVPFASWLESDGRIERGLEMLADVLDGLAVAHAAGVVHGDLKPENILVTDASRVKLCDFGIAQIVGPSKQPRALRIAAGTPHYMAPEQLRTDGSLDPRTDLYAMGVLLYELVTGQPGFAAETLGDIVRSKLVKPPVAYFDKHGEPVPRALGALMADLMSPQLHERPRFAAAVAAQVRAAVSLFTPSTARASPGPRPRTSRGTELLPSSARRVDAVERAVKLGTKVSGESLPGVALLHVRSPPLVGRDEDIERLRAVLAAVASTRRSRVVLVEGPSGVGKSRLAEWAMAECERSGSMESAAVRFVGGGSSRRSLRALVARLFAPTGDLVEETKTTMTWLDETHSEEEVDVEALGAWLAAPPEEDEVDPLTAASLAYSALRAMSRAHPICIWFDDLDLARDGSLELTERLASGARGAILVVATLSGGAFSGDEEAERVARWARMREARHASAVTLGPLSPAHNARILAEGRGLDALFADRVAFMASGLPLFFVQVVGAWIDRGELDVGPSGLVPRGSAEQLIALASRSSGDDVVRRRVDHILARGRAAKLVLYATALLGAFCTDARLRSVANGMGADDASIDLAIEESLLRGVLVADGTEYALCQPLFRRELLHRARADHAFADLASRVALALEPEAAKRPQLAVHIALLRREANANDAAYATLLGAADALARIGDCDQADRQLRVLMRWALTDALPRADATRHSMTYVEARVAFYRHDQVRARAILDELIPKLDRARDPSRAVAAELLHASVSYYLGDAVAAQHRFERVRQEFGALVGPGTAEYGRLMHGFAMVAAMRGDLERADALLAEGIAGTTTDWIRCFLLLDRVGLASACGAHADAARHYARARSIDGWDVGSLGHARELEFFMALARGEERDPRLVEEHARTLGDAWRRTGCCLMVAAHAVTFSFAQATALSERALDAFAIAPHDEPASQWCLARIADGLAGTLGADTATRARTIARERRARALGRA